MTDDTPITEGSSTIDDLLALDPEVRELAERLHAWLARGERWPEA